MTLPVKLFFSFGYFLLHVHGSSNLEKVLNSVKVLEKYLISLLGIEKSLKFTTLKSPFTMQNSLANVR